MEDVLFQRQALPNLLASPVVQWGQVYRPISRHFRMNTATMSSSQNSCNNNNIYMPLITATTKGILARLELPTIQSFLPFKTREIFRDSLSQGRISTKALSLLIVTRTVFSTLSTTNKQCLGSLPVSNRIIPRRGRCVCPQTRIRMTILSTKGNQSSTTTIIITIDARMGSRMPQLPYLLQRIPRQHHLWARLRIYRTK